MLAKTDRPFHPWGMNYGHYGMLVKDFANPVWDTLRSDFKKMKSMGANVVRIHVQYDRFMLSPNKPNPKAIAGYQRLLKIAKKTGLYLDITGLACYLPSARVDWYDSLDESHRWAAQAYFWKTIAKAGKGNPSVFCYDLMNEPATKSKPQKKGDWYGGQLGKYEFTQLLTLDRRGRSQKEIFSEWINEMTSAIRKEDKHTLITVGLFSFMNANFNNTIAPELDFLSGHFYPKTGHINESMKRLRNFKTGKPVVIEEIFPLKIDTAGLTDFMRRSKSIATGWMGHYLMSYSLKELEKVTHKTPKEAIYQNWLSMFVQLKPQFAPNSVNCNKL
jgi:hypothetical protein